MAPARPIPTLAFLVIGAIGMLGAIVPRPAAAGPLAAAPVDRTAGAFVFEIHGASFEQLMAVPQIAALARQGGAALMVAQEPVSDVLARLPSSDGARELRNDAHSLVVVREDLGTVPPAPGDEAFLAEAGKRIEATLSVPGLDAVVAVVGVDPSRAMIESKDQVLPALVARGTANELFRGTGPQRALTSNSTRRTGVVSSSDLPRTLYEALGRTPPVELEGAAITAADAPPPFELHARYLEMRRMSVPIQTAALLYVTVVGVVLVALLSRRDRLPAGLVRRASWLGLTVAPLAVALLAAGHLPTLSYAIVVPFVIAVTALATLAAATLRGRGLLAPTAAIGAGVLAYFVVEAATGFSAALTPFLGGSELDGGRFFGLPNVFEGLLVGAALYLVASWGVRAGMAVLVAVAVFMGLPGVGADIGGALVGFSAAGLWLGLRRRGRIDAAAGAMTALTVAVGMGIVLGLHRYVPGTPTHATRFLEGESGGLMAKALDRLDVGLALIARNPLAAIPAVGVIAMIVLTLRPPRSIRRILELVPRWRDVVLTLSVAGVVALVGNDSGPSAAGLAFGLALGGLLYVSLSMESEKMEADEPTTASVG